MHVVHRWGKDACDCHGRCEIKYKIREVKRLKIKKEDLQEMLGIEEELTVFEELEKLQLSYRILGGVERDEEILNCIKRILSDTKVVGTPERHKVWEDGWNENLVEFSKNYDTDMLKPKFFRSYLPLRLKGELIKSDNPNFQIEMDLLIKRCLFEKYASLSKNIYEFGCGTGYNLVMLGDMYPEKQLFGMDFTDSTVKILDLLKEKIGYRIEGRRFDFCNPDNNLQIEKGSVVFTFAALEQIGNRASGFIDYLISQGVERVVHLEPILELYDENNLLDFLAKWFHEKRGYLSGLLPYLQELEGKSLIKIEKIQRCHSGDHNNESHTIIVWSPKKETAE